MEAHYNGIIFNYKINRVDKARAVVLIVHGICEHIGRYDETTTILNKFGYTVYRFDKRGHGLTGGPRGDIDSYESLISDIDCFVNQIHEEQRKKKVYLLGNSMGGLEVHLYALINQHKIDGVISLGGVTGFMKKIKLLRFLPLSWIKQREISSNWEPGTLCSIPAVERHYFHDELRLRYFTTNLVKHLFITGVKTLTKNFHIIKCPILYLHSTNDKLCPPDFSTNAFSKVLSSDKRIYMINNSAHELLQDASKELVFKIIIDWLNRRTTPREND